MSNERMHWEEVDEEEDTTIVLTDQERQSLARRTAADLEAYHAEGLHEGGIPVRVPKTQPKIIKHPTDDEQPTHEKTWSNQYKRSRRVWIGIAFIVLVGIVIAVSVSVTGRNKQTLPQECQESFVDCDGDIFSNGCETDIMTSLDHCGTCGNAVTAVGQTCINGTVQCDYTPFEDMTLNGNSDSIPIQLSLNEGCGIRLTNETTSFQASSMFQEVVFSNSDYSFSMYAAYRMFGDDFPAGDGMAFVMHQDSQGTEALGSTGEGIGYDGIESAMAVELDTFLNSNEEERVADHAVRVQIRSTLINDGGSPAVVSKTTVQSGLRTSADGSTPGGMWIDYDGAFFSIYHDSSDAFTRPDVPIAKVSLSLEKYFNGSIVNAGFTAATGNNRDNHDIVAWSISQP